MTPGWQRLLAALPQPGPGRITVGLAIDTGPHGASLLRAAAAGADDISRIGYMWVDDHASADGGARAAQALVQAGVRLVIGHFNSASALAAAPFYRRAGALLMAPAATHPALTTAMPRCFRVCPHDGAQAELFANTLRTQPERPVLLVQDGAAARGLGDAIERLLGQAGREVMRCDAPLVHLRTYRDAPVAIIGRHGFAAEALPLVDVRSVRLLSDDCNTPQLAALAGAGAYVAAIAGAGGGDGEHAYAATSAAAVAMLGQAIAQGGSDPAVVAGLLREGRWRSVLGEIGFDAAGEAIGLTWRWRELVREPA